MSGRKAGRALRSRRAIAVVGGVVVVVVAGGGYAAYAAQGTGGGHYRTATVTTGDVAETLELSGTITPTRRNDVAFATSGTVSKVAVSVGEKVAKGEVLARLDTTTLEQSLARAQAQVASAKAQLATDQASSSSSSEDSSSGGAPAGSSGVQALSAAVAVAQRLCVSDDTAQSSGQPSGQPSSQPTGQPSADASSASSTVPGTGSAPPSGTKGTKGSAGQPATCADALAEVQREIQGLSTTSQADGLSDGVGSGFSGRGSSTGTVTAATIARDEASVAEAQASLVSARVALKAAVIKAPVAGTVAEVDVSAGGQASAGTVAVTVIAPGTTTVTLSASSTQVRKLSVGQKATVTPAGSTDTYQATVTSVSNVPASSNGSDTTYPVTITLQKRGLTLLTGAGAAVDVVIGESTGVLTVPTSAVSDGVVTVVEDGKATRTRVTTGLVGPALTEIADGLDAGETVVLADLDAAMPTSSSSNTGFTRLSFGGSTGFSQVRRAQ
jgi:HlyD family secretion protein